MKTLADLKADVDLANTALEEFKAAVATSLTGIAGDVQNLDAQIEALKAQITDPVALDALAVSLASLKDNVGQLSTIQNQAAAVDAETPPTPAPGT
jgi:hypothetical protein